MAQIYGTTPYAGVKPVSGERPVLVVLLEAYNGDNPEFNTYYGACSTGELYELLLDVSRNDGSINKLEAYKKLAAPFAASHPPAVARSPHPHNLTLLFATGSDGRVYQTFYDRHEGADKIDHPWTTWQQLPDGIQADSAPCVLNAPDGSLASAFVTASDMQVYQSIFARGPGQAWAQWESRHFPRVSSGPAAMNSTDGSRAYVFATGTTGHVYLSTYVRGPGSHWEQMQLPDGPLFKDTPACYAASDGTLESVLALGRDGIVYQTIRSPQPNNTWSPWTALPTNVKLRGGLSTLDAYNRNSLSAVAVDTTGQLVRCRYVRGSMNQWTSWTPVPVEGAPSNWKGASQLTTPATTESAESYRKLFFGAHRSLRNYFWEVSQGRFTIREAGLIGWIHPRPDLTIPDDAWPNTDIKSWDFVHDSGNYNIPITKKSAWVIEAAERIGGFKYSDYDSDGSGTVSLEDLAIVWIYSSGDSGRVRGVDPAIVKVPSLTGGVSQEGGLPRFGPNLSLRVPAEEVAHAILKIVDLYDDPTGTLNPLTEPLQLAITGSGGDSPHLSPWDKMKVGWAMVRVAKESGWYELPAVEQTNEILILRTSAITDEYFILENRFPPGSFEDSFRGAGLAVWHIVEKWADGSGDTGRNTILLLHCQPVASGAWGGETFVWDGANPNQSYDLTDTSAPANLQWSDGTWSGLRIESISPSGAVMRFHLTVPTA